MLNFAIERRLFTYPYADIAGLIKKEKRDPEATDALGKFSPGSLNSNKDTEFSIEKRLFTYPYADIAGLIEKEKKTMEALGMAL